MSVIVSGSPAKAEAKAEPIKTEETPKKSTKSRKKAE